MKNDKQNSGNDKPFVKYNRVNERKKLLIYLHNQFIYNVFMPMKCCVIQKDDFMDKKAFGHKANQLSEL